MGKFGCRIRRRAGCRLEIGQEQRVVRKLTSAAIFDTHGRGIVAKRQVRTVGGTPAGFAEFRRRPAISKILFSNNSFSKFFEPGRKRPAAFEYFRARRRRCGRSGVLVFCRLSLLSQINSADLADSTSLEFPIPPYCHYFKRGKAANLRLPVRAMRSPPFPHRSRRLTSTEKSYFPGSIDRRCRNEIFGRTARAGGVFDFAGLPFKLFCAGRDN